MRVSIPAWILAVCVFVAAPNVLWAQSEDRPAPPVESEETMEGADEALAPPSEEDVEDIEAILRGEEALFGATEGYVYDPEGRRDPFKSLLEVSDRPDFRGPRPEGVPGLLIDEVNLIAILRTSSGYIAQVQAADKQKSYLLRPGDQLYDGEVVDIESGEVVFQQVVQDPTALKPFRERVKTLNP